MGAFLQSRVSVVWLAVAANLLGWSAAPAAGEPPRADRYGDPLPDGALARVGTVRFRQGGAPPFLSFTPDGKTLISADSAVDTTIRFWEAATGRQVRQFT